MQHTTIDNAFFRQLIFLVVLFFLGIIIFKQLSFFIGSFLGAITLYIVFRNLLFEFTDRHKMKPWLASLIIVVLSTIVLLGFGLLIFEFTAPHISNLDTEIILDTVNDWIIYLSDHFGIKMGIEQLLTQSTSMLTRAVSSIFSTTYSFAINILLMLIILYFMLANAKRMEKTAYKYSPFSGESMEVFKDEVRSMIYSNAVGMPLILIGQAVAAYFLFLAFGIPNAILWAFLTAICGLIPMIGTAIITVPMGIITMTNGAVGKGLLIIFCGLFIIANVDNVLRIILMKKTANTHPLIVIFGIILGIPMFGFWGIIFGPLLIASFILLIKIYYREYKLLKTPPNNVQKDN